MRTTDLDQAVEAVTKVFCPHKLQVLSAPRRFEAVMSVAHPTSQPLVDLSYGAPVRIDTGMRLYLMMHCARGSASVVQRRQAGEWRRRHTMPLTAGMETELRFDDACLQRSVALDPERVEAHCTSWLGGPVKQPLRFALRPFSDDLERVWQRTLSYLWADGEGALPIGAVAKAAFDDYLLTLLLHHHPHNYSDEFARRERGAAPGMVCRAERFMVDHAAVPIMVADVAAEAGVSVRSLQAGFHQWRATTPMAFLRDVRLQSAQVALLHADEETSVTAVAVKYGFSHLGRFSAYYRAKFGETPSATLQRSRLLRRRSSRGAR